jgi:O-antigen ligase
MGFILMFNTLIAFYLLLLPYDHFPFSIPGSSKPISFLILLSILCLRIFNLSKKYKNNTSVINLFVFSIFSIILTLVQGGLLNYFEMKETSSEVVAIKGLSSIVIFFLGYELIFFYVTNFNKYIYVVKLIVFSFILPITVGLVHLISFIPSFNFLSIFVETVTRFFVDERGDENFLINRVSMLTMEPSWAAQQLLVMFIPIVVVSRSFIFKNKFLFSFTLILLIFLLLGTASGLIALWLVILFLLFSIKELFRIITKFKISSNYLKSFFVLILLICLISIFVSEIFNYQTLKFDKLIAGGLASEPSTAIRFYNPVIGLNVFINENPIFGVGLSMFGFYIPTYSPSWYAGLAEGIAMSSLSDPYFGSPRNMYVKLLVETGVIGFAFFSFWFLKILSSLKYIKKYGNHNEYLGYSLVIIGIITSFINFDSLANLYIPTLLALIKVRSDMLKDKNDILVSIVAK